MIITHNLSYFFFINNAHKDAFVQVCIPFNDVLEYLHFIMTETSMQFITSVLVKRNSKITFLRESVENKFIAHKAMFPSLIKFDTWQSIVILAITSTYIC